MDILRRDDLERGGFAGVREHRIVMSPEVFGSHAGPDTWPGIGQFVYLADANFVPRGETPFPAGHRPRGSGRDRNLASS